MSQLTDVFAAIAAGNPGAAESMWRLVYHELHRLAASRLALEQPGQTLQVTALVHEAYLRLSDGNPEQHWANRAHFFAAAAESMRRILVDRARSKNGPRRGGRRHQVELESADLTVAVRDDQLLAINDALDLLAQESAVKAELVKLRFFAGLDHQEAATLLGISRATADRYWSYAKAFLYDALSEPDAKSPPSAECLPPDLRFPNSIN